ncbi:hypothetical protein ACFX11_038731 [Malus domestica]
MKTRLKEKFLAPDFTQYSFSQFNNLRQETKSVVEYTEEFYKLSARNDIQETEEQLTARYIGGLRPQIRDEVEMHRVCRVNDAYQLALKVEARLARTRTRRAADFHSFYPSSKGESSHGWITNGKANHQYKSCPKRQVDTRVALGYEDNEVEYFNDSIQPKFDEDNDVEREEIEPEIGETLVIHRVFSTLNCENIVSQDMIDKLKLQTEPRPRPYRIAWFKKGNEVKFSRRCLVSFSMGKNYKDQVWCDAVPMDICHILLGRPWQFDRRTTHDGLKNNYTFRMGKSEIVLLPSKEEEAIPKIQQEKGKSTNVPRKVELVLDEFKDVIPDELPSGLPPLKDI